MKKISFILCAAAMMLAGFTSCGQVEDNAVPGGIDESQYDKLVYDFAAAAAAGENPDNKNGSAANGQAFYGWENEGKTDSKRQDYKGYEWKEGSVLPEVCHVWRRSDRINNSIVEGGLNCTNDREMAIDGLVEGSIVQIFYDATAAADDAKEIVWAVAVTAEGEVHGATATVNGAEAISGVTTIAPGANIAIKSVEPAENSELGYIVVKVKKGMIISKIVILNPKA